MSLLSVSSKGQITIPANIRASFGINPKDKVRIIVHDNEIILKPIKSFRKLRGSISLKEGNSREKVAEAVVKHVMELDD